MNITEHAELNPGYTNSHQCLFYLHLDYFNKRGSTHLCILEDCKEAAFVPELMIYCWLQSFSSGPKTATIDQEVLEEGLRWECMVING